MLLDQYDTEDLFDEMFASNGEVRPHYQLMRERLDTLSKAELDQKIRNLETLFLKQGITFTVYGDQQGTERVFPFDPIPRIIPAEEWQVVEDGLVQRITALNLFL